MYIVRFGTGTRRIQSDGEALGLGLGLGRQLRLQVSGLGGTQAILRVAQLLELSSLPYIIALERYVRSHTSFKKSLLPHSSFLLVCR